MTGSKWIAIGLVCAILVFLIFSRNVDGFQNTAPKTSSSIKEEVCSILNDTYNSVKFRLDNLEPGNNTMRPVLETHLSSIESQKTAQGC